jgi:UDPglucose--hexose-1-phosphate uridylyltransferase
MPFLPPKIKEQLQWCENYKTEHDREFFDDMIYDEKNFKKGILKENNYFLAYCPYASKYPFEIMVIAKKQTSSIHLMGDDALYALSEISRYLFETLFKKLGDFSFNMILKNGDIQNEQNPNRFHMQILPRLYKTAGFELDGDIFINTFLPEQAAKILKDN